MYTMNTEIQTQQAFRTIMRAMGYPGSIQRLGNPLHRRAGTANLQLVAETLLDQDVTFCVVGDKGMCELEEILHERTNSPLSEISLADLIIVTSSSSRGKLLTAKTGTPEYPDRNATVLFSVETLADGSDRNFLIRLTGPGIQGEKYIKMKGLDYEELRHLSELNCGYPLGIDSIFVDQIDRVMYVPRSAKIELK